MAHFAGWGQHVPAWRARGHTARFRTGEGTLLLEVFFRLPGDGPANRTPTPLPLRPVRRHPRRRVCGPPRRSHRLRGPRGIAGDERADEQCTGDLQALRRQSEKIQIHGLTLSPDGKKAIIGQVSNEPVSDPRDGKPPSVWVVDLEHPERKAAMFTINHAWNSWGVLSPDGKLRATGGRLHNAPDLPAGWDGSQPYGIQVWDVATGKQIDDSSPAAIRPGLSANHAVGCTPGTTTPRCKFGIRSG